MSVISRDKYHMFASFSSPLAISDLFRKSREDSEKRDYLYYMVIGYTKLKVSYIPIYCKEITLLIYDKINGGLTTKSFCNFQNPSSV